LLIGIFGLIYAYHISFGWNKKKALRFANFDAISKVTRETLFPKSNIPLIFRVAVLVLIILALSGLGVWYEGYSSDPDYMLIIDASGSMLAEDFAPNRLEAAKESAIEFMDLLNADTNVGVISFAGTSFVQQTLTNERSLVKDSIKSIDVINVGGTAIGDAIVLASNVFKVSEENDKSRSIILLTDGRSNVGISLDDAIDYAISNGVVINTVGIGTEEGANFIDELAFSQLDLATLQDISKRTGGESYLAANKEELKNSYFNIFSSIKSNIFLDARPYLLLLVFALLLLEGILANTRYKTII